MRSLWMPVLWLLLPCIQIGTICGEAEVENVKEYGLADDENMLNEVAVIKPSEFEEYDNEDLAAPESSIDSAESFKPAHSSVKQTATGPVLLRQNLITQSTTSSRSWSWDPSRGLESHSETLFSYFKPLTTSLPNQDSEESSTSAGCSVQTFVKPSAGRLAQTTRHSDHASAKPSAGHSDQISKSSFSFRQTTLPASLSSLHQHGTQTTRSSHLHNSVSESGHSSKYSKTPTEASASKRTNVPHTVSRTSNSTSKTAAGSAAKSSTLTSSRHSRITSLAAVSVTTTTRRPSSRSPTRSRTSTARTTPTKIKIDMRVVREREMQYGKFHIDDADLLRFNAQKKQNSANSQVSPFWMVCLLTVVAYLAAR